MIPVIPSVLVLIYAGKSFCIYYFSINLIITLFVYYQATRYYFPNMKDKKNQYFHEKYKTFERDELHMISLIKLYHGFLNYFWFKAFFGILSLAMVWLGIT